MSETNPRKRVKSDPEILEFTAGHGPLEPLSSSMVRTPVPSTAHLEISRESVATSQPVRSPAFKALSEFELAPLARENRARLLIQAPNRIFFYWSTSSDPFQLLNRAFAGKAGNYTLVLKLADLKRGTEEITPVESEGSSWFNVEADGEYQAELGLYSKSGPYIRVIYSNIVQTPRKSPSPHRAKTAEWHVSANTFSKALDASGFKTDAFDVAIAGDDPHAADALTRAAFGEFLDANVVEFSDIPSEELRYSLLALASNIPLESLRWKIGARLFALLQDQADTLSAEHALSALKDRFDVEPAGFFAEDTADAVHGASLINFPKRLRYRPLRDFKTVSSHSTIER